nr:polysaccharide biosynthesis/export family protein [Moraxella sp. CTOTU49097]
MLAKLIKLSPIIFALSFAGCSSKTAITSGMNVGKLPESTVPDQPVSFVADNGIRFNVTELTANNIPAPNLLGPRTVSFPPVSKSAATYSTIAKGDVIEIFLPGYPEITQGVQSGGNSVYSSGYLVDQSGFLQFPMIGRVKAEGLTVSQLTNQIANLLSRYLKHPDPQVRVLSYRGHKFYVDGQVKSPGQYDIADQPVNLYTAISMAGGTINTSDTNNIQLIRDGRTYNFGFKSLQNAGYSPNSLYLRNGDTIKVGDISNHKVTVMGEFTKPSTIQIPENGLSLISAIGEANGIVPTSANAKKVYILRENNYQNESNIYHIDLTSITNFSVANRFKLQPGDVVYVDPTGLVRWNRIISQILPSYSITNIARTF